MYLPIDTSSSALGWNYSLGWGHAGLLGKGERHPGEPCCPVYQLGRNVKDLVNGELINCLFSPSFPIEDAAFESLEGEEPGRAGQSARRSIPGRGTMRRATGVHVRARVCVQTCMRLTVNNVAGRPAGASAGGCFCQRAHVSHRGPRWLLCLSVCTQKPKPNERHKGGQCVWGKKRRKEIWKGDMSNFPQTTAADQVIRLCVAITMVV